MLRWPTRIGIQPGWTTPTDPEQATLRATVLDILAGVRGVCLVNVTMPDEWDVLTGPLWSTSGEGTNAFLPYLQADVAQFANRLTGFLSGALRSASSYLKVLEARYLLFKRVQTQLFAQCDVMLATNVAFDGIGHPLCSFPIGFGTDATTGITVPRGAVLGGPPFSEERILSVICAYQALTDWHLRRPPDPTVDAGALSARVAPFTIEATAVPPDEQ